MGRSCFCSSGPNFSRRAFSGAFMRRLRGLKDLRKALRRLKAWKVYLLTLFRGDWAYG